LKALLNYEIRRIFTKRTLVGIALFIVLFTIALLIAGGMGTTPKGRILEKAYYESQVLYASAALASHSLVLFSGFMAASLFQRGGEDIALLMRVKRPRLCLFKGLTGIGFMAFMALAITLIMAFALIVTGASPPGITTPFSLLCVIGLYYFSLMAMIGTLTKSPRSMIIPIMGVIIIDTFIPYNPSLKTPVNTFTSMVLPMFDQGVLLGGDPEVSWATLVLTGLFFGIAFSVFQIKSIS